MRQWCVMVPLPISLREDNQIFDLCICGIGELEWFAAPSQPLYCFSFCSFSGCLLYFAVLCSRQLLCAFSLKSLSPLLSVKFCQEPCSWSSDPVFGHLKLCCLQSHFAMISATRPVQLCTWGLFVLEGRSIKTVDWPVPDVWPVSVMNTCRKVQHHCTMQRRMATRKWWRSFCVMVPYWTLWPKYVSLLPHGQIYMEPVYMLLDMYRPHT